MGENTYRQKRSAKIRALPIKFRKVEPGVYESCGVPDGEVGPRAGEYRIHKTEHSGRNVSHSGRVRWHVRHVPTSRTISHRFAASYALSLEDAIDMLHIVIGRGLRDGFEVLAKMNTEADRHLQAQRAARERRARLEAAIGRGLDEASRDESWRKMDRSLVIGYVADAVQAEAEA